MVNPVISDPFQDCALVGYTGKDHQNSSHDHSGLVRTMGPQAMSSCGDAKARDEPENDSPEIGDHHRSLSHEHLHYTADS
mmetsp:Transcript_6009/g.5927  ORF Transcript_6009/g.5927 Transcript_6009/m.5927 type:complete len:80 (-) Transcript_6009:167-406(-)